MGSRLRIAYGVGVLALALGCAKASEESRAKRSPNPVPAEPAEPGELGSIPLWIRGTTAPALTGARLEALSPDFSSKDGRHRAWKLRRLLEGFLAEGDVIQIEGKGGVSVTYAVPDSEQDAQPVLLLSRRGELVATLIDPAQPFPEFHGHGGQLGRTGDPSPRISDIQAIRVQPAAGTPNPFTPNPAPTTDETGVELARATLTGLRIEVDGEALRVADRLAALEPTMTEGDHDQARPTWSLAAIAAAIDPKARVVTVFGDDGERRAISAEEWQSQAASAVLRANRRGMLKLHWGATEGEGGRAEIRRVTGLELQRVP